MNYQVEISINMFYTCEIFLVLWSLIIHSSIKHLFDWRQDISDVPTTRYIFVTISVIWQLLSGFCLTHMMLCDCDIEEKGLLLLCISKLLCRETIEWKYLHFFMREWGREHCWGVLYNRHVIKKRINDGKSAGSGRKTVVDCDSLRDAIRGTASIAGCYSRGSLRDATREKKIFWPLSARLLTPLPLSMRLLIT